MKKYAKQRNKVEKMRKQIYTEYECQACFFAEFAVRQENTCDMKKIRRKGMKRWKKRTATALCACMLVNLTSPAYGQSLILPGGGFDADDSYRIRHR